MNHNHYNKKLKTFAKDNRKSFTKAEACMWKYVLGKKQMAGYGFKRQRPIANYIVDFTCLPLKLIIEIDGYSHQIPENEARDVMRQQKLEDLGFTVLRFKDEEVLNHINVVRQVIYDWIEVNDE